MKLSKITLGTMALAILSGTTLAQMSGTGPGERPGQGGRFTKIGSVSEAQPLVIEDDDDGPWMVRIRLQNIGEPVNVNLVSAGGALLQGLTLEGSANLEGFVLRPGERPRLIIDDIGPQPRRPRMAVTSANAQLGSEVGSAGSMQRNRCGGGIVITEGSGLSNGGEVNHTGPQGWGTLPEPIQPTAIYKFPRRGGAHVLASAEFEPIGSEDDLPGTSGGSMSNGGEVEEEGGTIYRAKTRAGGLSNEGEVQHAGLSRAKVKTQGGGFSNEGEVEEDNASGLRAKTRAGGLSNEGEVQHAGLSRAKVKTQGGGFSNEGEVEEDDANSLRAKTQANGMSNEGQAQQAGFSKRLRRTQGGGFSNEGEVEEDDAGILRAKTRNPGVSLGSEVSNTSGRQIPDDAGSSPVDGTKKVASSTSNKAISSQR